MSINKRILRATLAFDADVESISGYLDEVAGPEVSDRLLYNIAKTLSHLVTFPSSGSLHYSEAASIDNLRMFPVTKFREYLVFYIDGPEEVVLVRLIHGKREVDVELDALDVK